MKNNLYLLIALFLFITSCQKREWNNPFGADCPKEIYTPTDFTAMQVGDSVVLSWSQPNNQISGFVITSNKPGGSYYPYCPIDKDTFQIIDKTIEGGFKYSYQLYAYAGTNNSNTVTAEITPVLDAKITTTPAMDITASTVIVGGNISSDGGSPITERGVCYSRNQNPATSSTKIIIGNGTGSFSNTITGLTANTTFYVRAYAINSRGTAYGNEVSFKTISGVTTGTVTDIDGNVYHTVTIGTQVWMVENLKVTKYRNGSAIPNVTNASTWVNLTTGAYCNYVNLPSNGTTYGRLYNYYTIADTRQICPAGWHVPDNNEWNILFSFLGNGKVAAGKMKETGTSHWASPNVDATNSSGFTALPGGDFNSGTDNIFNNLGTWANFWSKTELDNKHASHSTLDNNNVYGVGVDDVSSLSTTSYLRYIRKTNGYSIRCIKD